jgi:hypothetical protein
VSEPRKRTALDRAEDLGRRVPGRESLGVMKYPLMFQSFTMQHPVIGSAILGIVVGVFLFLLTTAATQGRAFIPLVVVCGVGAVVIFIGNWIGAVRGKKSATDSPNQ